jgi:alpha-beta hydrolase superfamily lysophospholipase
MTRRDISAAIVALTLLFLVACRKPAVWSDLAPHKSGFVIANGIRLNYLDWGVSGPALVLIHGCGNNLHLFDDLASALTDRFCVIAYARRGHGRSWRGLRQAVAASA